MVVWQGADNEMDVPANCRLSRGIWGFVIEISGAST